MTQKERREYLITFLKNEKSRYSAIRIPEKEETQREVLRILFNLRDADPIGPEFLSVQDDYLKEAICEKGIVSCKDLPILFDGISLWKGDITRLDADAIVNASSGVLSVYHGDEVCVENSILTYAGLQLRREWVKLMEQSISQRQTPVARLTKGWNLPAQYIIHTTGPFVYQGELCEQDEQRLAECYRSCLDLAREHNLKSIAFPCIATGYFQFPRDEAARIALDTVLDWKQATNYPIHVIFDVFTEDDEKIYQGLLSGQAFQA